VLDRRIWLRRRRRRRRRSKLLCYKGFK